MPSRSVRAAATGPPDGERIALAALEELCLIDVLSGGGSQLRTIDPLRFSST
ncbi:MAG: hypothetical protein OXN89_09620 [Bryobacterales bacterium]|nr:hypothetical protein [Bryobacterales bacterium]